MTPSPFGTALRQYRESPEINMSQYDLADHIGVTFSLISHMESGRRPPSPEVLDALVAAFGLSGTEEAKFRYNVRYNRMVVRIKTPKWSVEQFDFIDAAMEVVTRLSSDELLEFTEKLRTPVAQESAA